MGFIKSMLTKIISLILVKEKNLDWYIVISDLSHELTFLADSFKGDERLFQNYREKSKVKHGL